jgi:tetratricopeptide (TPR) repeat protein
MSAPQPPQRAQPELARQAYAKGLELLGKGDPGGARSAFTRALALDPSHAPTHYQLGNCLRLTGDEAGAETALKAAIQWDATLNDAYISLAYLYRKQDRRDSAAATLLTLAGGHRADLPLMLQIAGLLMDMDNPAEAASLYEACLKLQPRSTQAHLKLGLVYQKLGRFKQAEQSLLAAIESDFNSDAAYLRLAHTRRWLPEDAPLIEGFETALTRMGLGRDTEVCLHFALGKMYDDLRLYDQAFGHFRRGNALYRERLEFDRGALESYIKRMKKICVPELFKRAQKPAKSAPAPVFVVGMLRSGTTLVERILASHPEVRGLGETEMADALAERLAQITGTEYPDCLERLDPGLAGSLAVDFRAGWPADARTAVRVVDKNPLNFLHLGLIALVFPEARILHCVRDPLDTCLSVYFQHFAHVRNNYAYALEDIAFFYNQYTDLMAHWWSVLPTQPHEVSYESLVAEPAATSRALVAAAGLTWHPDCLRPHEHPSAISTASVWQARQPINRDSVGRWLHYAEHLDGLRQNLVVHGSDHQPEAG